MPQPAERRRREEAKQKRDNRQLLRGDLSTGQYMASIVAPQLYDLAHDEDLSGGLKDTRLWLIRHELEKLWDEAQRMADSAHQDRPGWRGWIARLLNI